MAKEENKRLRIPNFRMHPRAVANGEIRCFVCVREDIYIDWSSAVGRGRWLEPHTYMDTRLSARVP